MAPPPRQLRDRRYAVDVPLEFRAVLSSGETVSGAARTVNLSRSGILFESKDSLPPGLQIQVFIEWPSRVDGALSVQLHGTGRTVRCRGNATAVMIQQCEFRAGLAASAERALGNSAGFLRAAISEKR